MSRQGCASLLLITTNVLILFGGVCDVTFGSMSELKSAAERVILIVSGIIKIFVCAPLGIYATAYRNVTMLRVYAGIVCAVVLLEIIFASVLIAQGKGKIPEAIKTSANKKFDNYADNREDRKYVDWVQEHYKCCGVDGPDYWTERNISIPYSCLDNNKKVYSTGCSDAVESYSVEFSLGVAGGTAITAGFKIIAIMLALHLQYTLTHHTGYYE
ncbi:unnamed protein product [Acanthoscelides obtectus]|uniref:Tetraspanin n=1 Tax=Acanthoscelides obtectus TaxID=200917 RepID=A0A9P0PD67_ACAOB|nr:unnamed protein product [Acanthoscelides obtectus]CAK1675542.1 Tetraspanin-6 [Acanthoscelides obtectus]